MDIKKDTKTTIIEGVLNHITFKSPNNNFIIGRFQSDKKEIAILGDIINPEIGQAYKLFGSWNEDPQWGKQLKFRTYEVVEPQNTDGIYRYIVRQAKWVGPAIGRALIEAYNTNTLNILRTDPEKVSNDIKGITLSRALEIQELIIAKQDIETALVKLESMIGGAGLRGSLPIDLVFKYKSKAPEIVAENPYIMIEEKYVGFVATDRVAINRLHVEPTSKFRQSAAAIHILTENIGLGHTWMNFDELVKKSHRLINHDSTVGIQTLLNKNRICIEENFVTLAYINRDEKKIAKKVKELLCSPI